jgi:hypothetical protein
MRRPSPALVVALIALFVALGGPAHALSLISGSQIRKNTITSKQVRNHSLSTKDLSRRAVHSLRVTPDGSITQAKLANGAVTSAKIGGAAITGAKIASNSISSIQIADHSLTATDIAHFSGSFTATVTATPKNTCWAQERRFAGADISNDVVVVTPGTNWPRDQLAFTVQNSPNSDGFVISGCNRSMSTSPTVPVVFHYIVFHVP